MKKDKTNWVEVEIELPASYFKDFEQLFPGQNFNDYIVDLMDNFIKQKKAELKENKNNKV